LLKAQITALETERDEELKAKGLLEETEEERLRKALQDAKEGADEESVINAKKELDRYLVKKAYDDKTLKATEEAEAKKQDLLYKSAIASWYLDSASIASQSVVAMMNAIATGAKMLNPVLSALYIGATGAAVATQAASHIVTYPKRENFYESGGIVPGTREGTAIIAGEKYKPELVSNATQMANILSAIGNGGYAGTPVDMTVIIQSMEKREMARYIIEDVLNKGVMTINPEKAIRKVLR